VAVAVREDGRKTTDAKQKQIATSGIESGNTVAPNNRTTEKNGSAIEADSKEGRNQLAAGKKSATEEDSAAVNTIEQRNTRNNIVIVERGKPGKDTKAQPAQAEGSLPATTTGGNTDTTAAGYAKHTKQMLGTGIAYANRQKPEGALPAGDVTSAEGEIRHTDRTTNTPGQTRQQGVKNEAGIVALPQTDRNVMGAESGNPTRIAALQDSTKQEEKQKEEEKQPADSVQVAAEEEQKNKKDSTRSRWYLKLPVSPDFTSINYNRPGKTGINIGLLVEYMPSPRIGITTGAIWSRKIYDMKNPEKTYGSGSYTAKADLLDGDCRVLDIPLNITYYIRPTARTGFFITAGFSSYIMLKENYMYTVKGTNKDYCYYENYTRKNNDWFSMLNLSMGIQHRISKRFQLQAEPFLKAPISGVGEGKVDLVSMGAFFSLKYQLTN
jgi:hypothetical protein